MNPSDLHAQQFDSPSHEVGRMVSAETNRPPLAARKAVERTAPMTTETRMVNWWKNRPGDQQFRDLQSLRDFTFDRAERSEVEIVKHQDLKVIGTPMTEGIEVGFHDAAGDFATGRPTHHAFGQLCSIAQGSTGGRIANWCRSIDPSLAADNLNYGLQLLAKREDTKVLSLNTDEGKVQRSLTSPSYGRLYDHQAVELVQEVSATSNGANWVVPSEMKHQANPERATTLYASDRDAWMFMVDDSRPIEVYNQAKGIMERLFRGFIVGNSEVGTASFFILLFLWREICANRMIYMVDSSMKELRIRHTSGAPERFRREAKPLLAKYAGASAAGVVNQVEAAMSERVGSDDDAAKDWLRNRQFNAAEAERIVKRANAEEGSARSVWDLVQGGTAIARDKSHTDDRAAMERRVSRLMTPYARAA